MSPVRSRETILAKVWRNPPTSKRYIMVLNAKSPIDDDIRVYDQRENRFVPDDEIERIDPDEILKI